MLKQKGYDLDGEIKNLFNKLDAIDGDREFINDVLEDLRESVDIIGAGSDKYYIRFRQAHENMNLMVAEEGGQESLPRQNRERFCR